MSHSSQTRLNTGALQVDGVDSLGPQATAVADASAATVQALTAATGTPSTTIVASTATNPTDGEFDNNCASFALEINALRVDAADLRVQVNDLLAKLRTHGLIAE